MKLKRIEEEDLGEEIEEDYAEENIQDDDNNLFKEDLGWDNLDNYEGSSYTPMEKHNDLLKELTNFEPFLKETVNGWLGLTWSQEKGKFIRDPFIQPIMNTTGAAWCVSLVKNYARRNNIITNLGKEEYNFIISDVIDVSWYNIPPRMEEFGIKNNGDAYRVCNEVEHIARLVLTGAGDGKYNKLLTETTSRNESVSMQQPMNQQIPQNQGFINNMKRFMGLRN